ncbi:MAG: type II toxin-antitoxin system RelE/ParE family toxin [bacterium]
MNLKQDIQVDPNAAKEILRFPIEVKKELMVILHILAIDGHLQQPYAKKLTLSLFEIRIKVKGQWRVIYAYLADRCIIILSAFKKKTQRTPSTNLQLAKKRLFRYL